ncbi:cytochrome ubiquinol oxidase subunit I [Alistipes putredinis]|uniref:cytochrome ubiquinol oxidase subunit I n=1 Tax=Alistipes putredinis TaxID=28117 RepID=UPI00399378D1
MSRRDADAIDQLLPLSTLEQNDRATSRDTRSLTAVRRPRRPKGRPFLRELLRLLRLRLPPTRRGRRCPTCRCSSTRSAVTVGAGCLFILLLCASCGGSTAAGRLANRRWLLRVMTLWSIPLATSLPRRDGSWPRWGRQPWAIQNLLPVSVSAVAHRQRPGGRHDLLHSSCALFTVLLAAEIGILCKPNQNRTR